MNDWVITKETRSYRCYAIYKDGELFGAATVCKTKKAANAARKRWNSFIEKYFPKEEDKQLQ